MKKLFLLLLCLIGAANTLYAQNHGQYDTAYWRVYGEKVMQNAPIIFKGRILKSIGTRVKDNRWGVCQIVITQPHRNNTLSKGDTIELQFNTGIYYDANGQEIRPLHNPVSSPSIRSETWVEQYFFMKPSDLPIAIKGSKRVIQFFDEQNPFTAYPFAIPGVGLGTKIFSFYTNFENEENFLQSLSRFVKPEMPKIIEIQPEIQTEKPIKTLKKVSKNVKKDKKGKKISYLNKQIMPTLTLNVNANLQRIINSTGAEWSLVAQTGCLDSSYIRSVTADFTYTSEYLPQNIANYIGVNIFPVVLSTLNTTLTNGTSVPAYETTIANIAPNKIRVTTALKYYPNAATYSKRYRSPGILGVRLVTTHPNVLCLSPLGEISNVTATYDMNKTQWQATPSGTYVINYVNTQYRSENAVACPVIDSLIFSPKITRAGVGDSIKVRAYAGGKPCTGYFGKQKGNILFRDANKDSGYVPNIDSTDILRWNDSVIVVRVPSLYTIDQPSLKGCAGSGFVGIVKYNEVLPIYTSAKLHVEYAAINYKDSAQVKRRIYLTNHSCVPYYPLRCDTSLSYSYRKCVWAAAEAWNTKLGYPVFSFGQVADTLPVSYQSDPVNNVVMRRVPSGLVQPGNIIKAATLHSQSTAAVLGGSKAMPNTTFSILFHPNTFINGGYQTDVPTLTNGNYVFNNILTKSSFYAAILHELGHGIGIDHCIDENHNDANPNLDAEIMYWFDQTNTTAANRRTLTSGNGESLKGGLGIVSDSKNINWVDRTNYVPFADPQRTFTFTKVSHPSERNICGYGSTGKITIRQNIVPPLPIGTMYTNWWAYDNGYGSWVPLYNSVTFTLQDSTAILKNNLPSTIEYININNISIKKYIKYGECIIPSDTVIFKASGSVILPTLASQCINLPAPWPIRNFYPTNGIFTAINTANNQSISGIDSLGATGIRFLKKWKFPTASTYKIVYTVPAVSYCPANTILTDSTWFSTFADCTPLNGTTHKLYINEVYKDKTPYRNGGINNDPCKTMKLNFTALGSFATGDQIKVKLSDTNGNIDTTAANLNNRVIGTYTFANVTNKTDSIQLTMGNIVNVASPNYRVQYYLKRAAAPNTIEWSEKNKEKINFSQATLCYAPPPPPCCTGGSRIANTFAPDDIRLYPNPTADYFTLQIPEYENATEIIITDAQGRVVSTKNLYNTTNEIATNNFANGIYFVRVAQGERLSTLKFAVLR